jgi:hypothetical protein
VAGDVLSGRVLAAGGEQEDLTAVDGEGVDGDECFIRSGWRNVNVGEGDEPVAAGGKEGLD